MSTTPPDNHDRWRENVRRQVQRMERAERERKGAMGQAAYVSALVMAIVVPTVVGAYLGRWLDGLRTGYSVRWTLSLIIVGLVVGFINLWLITRERP
jgi:ATP synthase protein I